MKTEIIINEDVNQSLISKGDVGYIDGYVRAADGRAYAVVVIPDKGIVDLVSLNQLKTCGFYHDLSAKT